MNRQPELMKDPQTKDGIGWSLVYRDSGQVWNLTDEHVFVKTQYCYFCRPLSRLGRRMPMLRREMIALRKCLEFGIAVPGILFYRELGDVAELVLSSVHNALPLNEALLVPGIDQQQIIENAATVIGTLHQHGWTHGALGNDHVLVQPEMDNRVSLIDLEKSRPGKWRIKKDLARFFRNTGCLSEEQTGFFLRHYERTKVL